MSAFEEWWESTEWPEMSGPIPKAAAMHAWDAALELAIEVLLRQHNES